jgi:hypothetical protein
MTALENAVKVHSGPDRARVLALSDVLDTANTMLRWLNGDDPLLDDETPEYSYWTYVPGQTRYYYRAAADGRRWVWNTDDLGNGYWNGPALGPEGQFDRDPSCERLPLESLTILGLIP